MATPNFTILLQDAVNKPGSIMQAYSAFHHYSLGNQLLALFECNARGIEPGPINTFLGWKDLGRYVKKGEIVKALFEITKNVEVVKKQVMRLDKRDDSALL